MKTRSLPSWVFLLFTPLSGLGQTPPSAAAEAKIGEITAKFQAAYDRDVGVPHARSVADVDAKYLAAVSRALNTATQAGNLDEALKLREEAKRLTDKVPLPPVDLESLPDSLKQLRATYRGALGKLTAERDAKAQPYYDHYDKLLEALQTELTKQGLIDDALAVKSKRDGVALDRPKIAAAPVEPPPDSGAMPKKTGTVSPSAVAQKGSPWRMAAEWALSLKAEVQIQEDGRKRNCREIKELPPGKFDIIGIHFIVSEKHEGMKMNEADLALLNPGLRTLEFLSLNKCNVTGPGLEAIAGAPKLRSMSLGGCAITDDAMKHLANLPSLEDLTVGITAMTGAGLSHLRGLPKLKKLHLDNLTAKQGDGRTFTEAGSQALGTLVQLQEFSAARGNLGDPRVKFTEGIGKLVNLRFLEIGYGTALSDADLAHLSGLTKLERVGFSNSRVSGTGIVHLKASAATLKSVALYYNCPVTDEAVQAIATTLPNLERLNVGYGASCGTASLVSLTTLKKLGNLTWACKVPLNDADPAQFALMPALEVLELFDTPVTDTGVAGIALCKKLTRLALVNVPVTDAAVPHLEKLKSLRTLRCPKSTTITDAGLAAFQKARPDVKLER